MLAVDVVAALYFVAAEVAVEELILITHSIVPIKPFHVAPISHSQEIIFVVVLIMPSHLAIDAAAEPLANTHALDSVVGSSRTIVRVMVLAVSNTLLDEIAEFLEEVQLHAVAAFAVAAA